MPLMQILLEKLQQGQRLLAGKGHSKLRMNLVMKRLEMTFFLTRKRSLNLTVMAAPRNIILPYLMKVLV